MTDRVKSSLMATNRRQFLGGTAALGVTAGLGGLILPNGGMANTPKQGGKMRIAMHQGGTTDSLDPATYTDIFMQSVGFATHGTMTELTPEGDLVGDLCESWEADSAAQVWTFKLRKGISFHNGKTMTADDLIASINHHRGEESKSAAKSNVAAITDLTKQDDTTVVFTLSAGNADFPYLMADYHLLIMPANEDGTADWESYVGTGGYTLEAFEPGVRATLKRNPNYWKPNRAHIDEIEVISISDPAARQNALVTGEVDYITSVDLKTVSLLSRRPGINIEESTGYLHYTAPMITTRSPYDNNELRLALKHGINREELVQKVLRGHGTVANDQPIAPTIPFAADLEQRTYDPDKAKFHLKKAGYDNIKLELSASDGAYSGAVDAAVLMKEHLAAAGMDIDVIREPADGYWSNVWMKKNWCQCYWGGRPTCDWMFTTAYEAGGSWNDTFWANDRFNVLLKQGRAELNNDNRAEIYAEMQQIVRDDGGAAIWGFANYVNAGSDKVQHGATAANWDMDGARFAERWWVA